MSGRLSLLISRDGMNPVTFEPDHFRLDPTTFGTSISSAATYELITPAGWAVELLGGDRWRVTPRRPDLDADQTFTLIERFADGQTVQSSLGVDITLQLRTTLQVERHAFPERNSAKVLGDVRGRPDDIYETYSGMPSWALKLLQHGLYRDIVYLVAQGQYRGGLCSGMARWAGLRALAGRDQPVPQDLALRQIVVLHGRQLTDHALLSSFKWFMRASPRAAYRAVRDDALYHGLSLRALDVNVPKPWRKDVATAIVRQGHTVVPVAVRQYPSGHAEVDVYDPNRGLDLQTITFDLVRDRYAFRSMVSMSESNVGMVAVPHTAYAKRGTAWLATAGSLVWVIMGRISKK